MTGNASPRIDQAFFKRMMDEVSIFGATAAGGLCRLTASPEDGAARDWLAGVLKAAGFRVVVDRVGNMFGILDIAGPGAPVVLAGSHLDSQPFGGRFDGAYGVVAAIAAATAVRDAVANGKRRPAYNVGVVNWTNEEGSRFAPSTLGSNVFAGKLEAEVALRAKDAKGVSLGEALAAIGYSGAEQPPRHVAAYIEAHIEQGPSLEREGKTIGVVEGNWGTVKYEVEFLGKAAHTGPTPMAQRRDALLPAAELVLFVRELSNRTGGALLSSVGRMDIAPNSTNVVAERVRLFVEFRDRDTARLDDACARFEDKVRLLGRDGVSVNMVHTVNRRPGLFDAALADLIEAIAAARGYSRMRLHTVAGHDAVPLASVLPSAMLFVPSVDGISHNEAEFTSMEDLVAGADVLAGVLCRLAFAGD
ncbi:MAG TPA: Zn-dependent hydrolase [Rhodospirillales bacterium]